MIHAAAIVDWGTRSPAEVYGVNFTGTENVIKACKTKQVKALVYTSSIDAVFTGKPLVDIDESTPYPTDFHSMYCQSKSQAEQLVLSENGSTLKTCALRPADIYGEGDPYHIAAFIDMAKSGFYVRIGDGKAKSQCVYRGNMAHAHILIAQAILSGNEQVPGKVYFITDAPGCNFFTFFDQIILRSGYKIWPGIWLPQGLAYTLGGIAEGIAWLLRPIKHYHPGLSRFAVDYTCTSFTFTAEKAHRDFNFSPKYSEEEALERTVAFYRNHR